MKDARRPGSQLWKHEKVSYLFIKSKVTPLFMSIAIQINKFISNHAKVLLIEIKDMKIDRRKKTRKPMTILQVNLTTSDLLKGLLKLFNHHLQ